MAEPTRDLPEPSDEDRRQHLEFIQAIVTRMSAASSTAKGWLLPVVIATYGYALTTRTGSIALLGAASVAVFALLDANYLRQERDYRRLYNTVARNEKPVPPFTLDPAAGDDPAQLGKKRGQLIRRWIPGLRVWLSWSIAPFYGVLLGGGMLIALVSSRCQ